MQKPPGSKDLKSDILGDLPNATSLWFLGSLLKAPGCRYYGMLPRKVQARTLRFLNIPRDVAVGKNRFVFRTLGEASGVGRVKILILDTRDHVVTSALGRFGFSEPGVRVAA